MVQKLNALANRAGDLGSILNIYMAAHNHL